MPSSTNEVGSGTPVTTVPLIVNEFTVAEGPQIAPPSDVKRLPLSVATPVGVTGGHGCEPIQARGVEVGCGTQGQPVFLVGQQGERAGRREREIVDAAHERRDGEGAQHGGARDVWVARVVEQP